MTVAPAVTASDLVLSAASWASRASASSFSSSIAPEVLCTRASSVASPSCSTFSASSWTCSLLDSTCLAASPAADLARQLLQLSPRVTLPCLGPLELLLLAFVVRVLLHCSAWWLLRPATSPAPPSWPRVGPVLLVFAVPPSLIQFISFSISTTNPVCSLSNNKAPFLCSGLQRPLQSHQHQSSAARIRLSCSCLASRLPSLAGGTASPPLNHVSPDHACCRALRLHRTRAASPSL